MAQINSYYSSSDIMFFGKYKVKNLIGSGNFGKIYSGVEITSHLPIALKIEQKDSPNPSLKHEADVYQHLPINSPYIPRFFSYHETPDSNALIISLLGKSLEAILQMYEGHFSLKTVLLLTDQMISCIQFLHENHYIHRDIKPDNFVIGLPPYYSHIYLLDLGLAKQFENPETHEHYSQKTGKSLVGTARYASINAMSGFSQSRRDDLESLGYIWVYFLRGRLPWIGLKAENQEDKFKRIVELKSRIPIEELCLGFPPEFAKYLSIVRNLKFDEEPPYSALKELFLRARNRLKISENDKMEWDIQPRAPRCNMNSIISSHSRHRSLSVFQRRETHQVSSFPNVFPKPNVVRPKIYIPRV